MNPTKTVTPIVSTHILQEIPRFFGGKNAMFREIIQNSVRAGATTLTVMADKDAGLITLRDNGKGLSDPQILLTVASSQWDSGVIDPAGMGILSTLNPEVTTMVQFHSGRWQFSMTPQQFASGESAEITEHEEDLKGFEVSLFLKKDAFEKIEFKMVDLNHTYWAKHFLEVILLEARAMAPLTLNYNGREHLPIPPSGYQVTLPQGEIYIKDKKVNFAPSGTYWEGFHLNTQIFDGIRQLRPFTLVEQHIIQQSRDWYFFPNHHSGLFPKLPDRTRLIENEALQAAGLQALDTINQMFLHALHSIPRLQQKVIKNRFFLREEQEWIKNNYLFFTEDTIEYRNNNNIVNSYLKDKEYRFFNFITHDHTLNVYIDESDGETTVEWETASYEGDMAFAPEVTVQANTEEAMSFYTLGYTIPGLPFNPEGLPIAEEIPLDADEIEVEENTNTAMEHIRPCNSIRYGEIELPWFVQNTTVYLKGDPKEAIKVYQENREEITRCFMAGIRAAEDEVDTLGIDESVTWGLEDFAIFLQNEINELIPELEQYKQELDSLKEDQKIINYLLYQAPVKNINNILYQLGVQAGETGIFSQLKQINRENGKRQGELEEILSL